MLCDGRAFFLEFLKSAACTRVHIGDEKELELGVGKNRSADIASFHHDAATSARRALQLAHPRAHRPNRGEARREVADFGVIFLRGDIATIEQNFLAVELYLNPLE